MTKDDLLPSELWAIERFRQAEEADFTFRDAREIHAETLRKLMLCLPIGPFAEAVQLSGTGIRIKGARIVGELNLKYGCLSDGGELPRLSLEDCDIRDAIILKSARLRRLCLKGSLINEVLADHAHISGMLDIRDVRPNPNGVKTALDTPSRHLARISLCGAHIEDGIEAGGAYLVGPEKDDSYVKYSQRAPYALDLPEARINGDLRLFPGFTACGGVNINGAVISGSFQAHGAHFSAGQLYALDGCGAVIHGNVALDSRITSKAEHHEARLKGVSAAGAVRFRCDGQLRLHNIVIDEDLRLYGAKIYGEYGRIAAENVTIRGDANLCAFDDALGERQNTGDDRSAFKPDIFPFECENRIDLRGAQITGDLNLKGAILGGKLDVSTSRIGGHVLCGPQIYREQAPEHHRIDKSLVQRFCAKGEIKLDGVEVGGNLIFEGAQLRSRLRAFGLKVHGYANFKPFGPEPQSLPAIPFDAHGPIILDSAIVEQKCDFSGASLHNELIAPNLQVGGKLLMCAYVSTERPEDFRWFEASGRVNLSGAKIQGDFDLTGAILALGIRFRGGSVKSALIIDIFDPPGTDKAQQLKRSIDFVNADTKLLSDSHYRGSVDLGYGSTYFLRLEGFSYGHFRHYVDDESLTSEELSRRARIRRRIAKQLGTTARKDSPFAADQPAPAALLDARLGWLKRQYRSGKPTKLNYNPDPYNTLYKYYKRMGAPALADDVLLAKLRIENKIGVNHKRTLHKILYKLFDAFCGYGLLPFRATRYSLILVFIIFATVWSADHGLLSWDDKLPWTAQILAHHKLFYAVSDQGRQSIDKSDPNACAGKGQVVNSLAYAFETVVPTLDLLERQKCDFTAASGWGWLLFKVLATLLGWTMFSITILTWTGLFRRNIEP